MDAAWYEDGNATKLMAIRASIISVITIGLEKLGMAKDVQVDTY